MKKRTIIILTIISSIISLIFIFSSYFGISRYLSLRMSSGESYVYDYKKLPDSGKDRVVISFTTTPERITKIKPFINSILDQTVRVSQIIFVCPDNISTDNIPKYITDASIVTPSGKNYGKGTKLIPVLFREKDLNTIIIALDDNRVYGKDFVECAISEINSNKNTLLISSDDSTIITKPKNFDSSVIDRNIDDFDDKWFIEKSKKSKVFKYTENIQF